MAENGDQEAQDFSFAQDLVEEDTDRLVTETDGFDGTQEQEAEGEEDVGDEGANVTEEAGVEDPVRADLKLCQKSFTRKTSKPTQCQWSSQ